MRRPAAALRGVSSHRSSCSTTLHAQPAAEATVSRGSSSSELVRALCESLRCQGDNATSVGELGCTQNPTYGSQRTRGARVQGAARRR